MGAEEADEALPPVAVAGAVSAYAVPAKMDAEKTPAEINFCRSLNFMGILPFYERFEVNAEPNDACDLLFLNSFDVDVDRDIFADHDTAIIQDFIPVHAKILPVNGPLGFKARAGVAPRVFGHAVDGHIEHDRFRHAEQRQSSFELESAGGRARLHLRASEGHCGILCGIEEVGGFQMSIALVVVGIDAGRLDGGLRFGGFGFRRVIAERSVELIEHAVNFGNNMVNTEADA